METTPQTYKINAHGHLLPNPEQIPRFMKEKEVFWLDDDRRFMRQKNWERPITDPSFFLDEKLQWMERHKIDHEVLLTLSQLYCNGVERQLSNDIIRFQNDFNASVQQSYPDKFTAGFVVQPLHLEDAMAEMERCVNELGLRMLCLPTHYLTADGQWQSVAHPDLTPLWALADQLELAIEIHPYDGQRIIGLKNEHWRFHLIWMCAQTADTYHCFSLLDFGNRYPKARVCFAHGNQFGIMSYGRRRQGVEGRPDKFPGMAHPDKSLACKNIFVDTLVHDVYSFRLLVDRMGTGQMVAGLDDPYPLGEMDTVPGCYPGKVINEAVERGFISELDRAHIWNDNVCRWLNRRPPNQPSAAEDSEQ
ncbi:MAG: amidohydrolase family protein [Bacteroidota bacterium]